MSRARHVPVAVVDRARTRVRIAGFRGAPVRAGSTGPETRPFAACSGRGRTTTALPEPRCARSYVACRDVRVRRRRAATAELGLGRGAGVHPRPDQHVGLAPEPDCRAARPGAGVHDAAEPAVIGVGGDDVQAPGRVLGAGSDCAKDLLRRRSARPRRAPAQPLEVERAQVERRVVHELLADAPLRCVEHEHAARAGREVGSARTSLSGPRLVHGLRSSGSPPPNSVPADVSAATTWAGEHATVRQGRERRRGGVWRRVVDVEHGGSGPGERRAAQKRPALAWSISGQDRERPASSANDSSIPGGEAIVCGENVAPPALEQLGPQLRARRMSARHELSSSSDCSAISTPSLRAAAAWRSSACVPSRRARCGRRSPLSRAAAGSRGPPTGALRNEDVRRARRGRRRRSARCPARGRSASRGGEPVAPARGASAKTARMPAHCMGAALSSQCSANTA